MKPLLLFLYATALYFVLSGWYRNGNTGIPSPKVLAAPTYLYSILGIVSGFTGGFTIPVALGLTFTLVLQSKKQPSTAATYAGPSPASKSSGSGAGFAAVGAPPAGSPKVTPYTPGPVLP